MAWHVGHKVGRNIYSGDGAADTVAVTCGPYPEACALAAQIVAAVNERDALLAERDAALATLAEIAALGGDDRPTMVRLAVALWLAGARPERRPPTPDGARGAEDGKMSEREWECLHCGMRLTAAEAAQHACCPEQLEPGPTGIVKPPPAERAPEEARPARAERDAARAEAAALRTAAAEAQAPDA